MRLILHYSLTYLLAVRPVWHHAGLLMLDCWTECSSVSRYLHNGRQGLMLLHMQIIIHCGQRAVLTVLDVCWGLSSRPVVCECTVLSCEGSAGQVHSCCSLQHIYKTRSCHAIRRTKVRGMPSYCQLQVVQDADPLRVEPAHAC